MPVGRIIAGSRYLVIPAVAGIALAGTTLILYAVALTVRLAMRPFREGIDTTTTKALILGAVELVALFLLGITLYVIALGLYELFIDPQLPVLPWLIIRDLDDLKARVLGIVIVVLGVLFLGQALTWDGQRDLLRFGAAIGAIIVALTYFLAQKSRGKNDTPS